MALGVPTSNGSVKLSSYAGSHQIGYKNPLNVRHSASRRADLPPSAHRTLLPLMSR